MAGYCRVVAHAALLACALLGGCSGSLRPDTSRTATPGRVPVSTPAGVDRTLVAQGAVLATIGDCRGCHTAPGGKSYAGGRALTTPFGTVYGTNITPDPETGIGAWTRADFDRAMREGVDAAGRNLYPVFPYDHFRHLADADLAALYAFLMTREPVHARTPPYEVRFPFNLRPLISAWKALYLDDVPLPSDPARGTAWNRGAYLVAGLGHCGACHTPRNALGAEVRDQPLHGGEAEGWHAPALDAASPSPQPWTADSLEAYLRHGIAPRHAIAAGPMAPIPPSLAEVPQQDVRAMAVYLASLQPARRAQPGGTASVRAPSPANDADEAHDDPGNNGARGAAIYASTCAPCHDAGRAAWPEGALDMHDWIGAAIPTASNLVRIVVEGIEPPPGAHGRWMPAFRGTLTRDQLIALATYVRAATGHPPWADVAQRVDEALAGGEASP
jgi:mono/diheme cytochrome c family protein